MLVQFSVSNFRSFGEEVTLNMVASNKLADHPGHCVEIPNTGNSVLRTAVLYGANAAGKSNLVKAMAVAQGAIQGRKDNAIIPFRFQDSSDAAPPTSFEFRFLIDERIFVYGFDVHANQFQSEWLALVKGNDELDLFQRDLNGNTTVNVKADRYFPGDDTMLPTLEALRALPLRKDQLFLNRAMELPEAAQGPTLAAVIRWLTKDLTIVLADSARRGLLNRLDADPQLRQFSARFLENVGTGVGDLRVVESVRAAGNLEAYWYWSDPEASIDTEIRVNPDDPDRVVERRLYSIHQKRFQLPFSEESDGTKMLLQFMPYLWSRTDANKVVVIDELDRSLHPLLCWEFLRFHSESCPGTRRQLIVTTHEAHLLNQELLRRDEYWFVEKDDQQQSKLVSLSDFNIRNDLQIQKGYLHGRFGAVPVIGGMQQLEELLNCPGEEGNGHAEEASPA